MRITTVALALACTLGAAPLFAQGSHQDIPNPPENQAPAAGAPPGEKSPGEKAPGEKAPEKSPTALGTWQVVDSDHQAWFHIYENNGVFYGKIARMFPKQGDEPNPVCSKCEGERHNAPWQGLTIITGMKRDGLNYENGRILDPRDGKVYSAQMKLSPDGQTLTVRGYLGVSALGQSQTWRRIPQAAQQAPAAPRTSGMGKR
jgi:uncharacterized protein (DUF2147 family)